MMEYLIIGVIAKVLDVGFLMVLAKLFNNDDAKEGLECIKYTFEEQPLLAILSNLVYVLIWPINVTIGIIMWLYILILNIVNLVKGS